MENRIIISGIGSVSRLSGNKYGQSVYTEQIEPKFDESCKNVLVFPNSIEWVAISFIEGMLSKLPNEIPRKDFFKFFSVEGKDSVINKFFDVVMMG